ncbi:MAG TPA: M48 family metallopeptidase [Gemmatimonadales bacterium]|nr:M48 family metallopeptidase [Gemmatimonadales bacterium]
MTDILLGLAQTPVPIPEPSELAVRYHRTGNAFWVMRTALDLALPTAFLWFGWSARLRDLSQRIGRGWLGMLLVYVVLFILLLAVVTLPLAFYLEYVRQHAYGLSNQTIRKWASDTATSIALVTVTAPVLALVPYGLLRVSPRRWWLWAGVAVLPILIAVFIVVPVWVAPLFNEFTALSDKALESRILEQASRAGIEGSRVYEVHKSVDTRAINAYVTGFGGTKRIVLYDTLLEKMTPDEILFVLGHEMGHYVLRHVVLLLAIDWILLVLSFWVIHRSAGSLLRRFGRRLGFHRLDDPASVPLLLLLASVLALALQPAILAISRHKEREADRFGLELVQNNHAAATAFVKLQQENLAVPRPALIYQIWRSPHPSLAERITFANEYRPWSAGAPLRYGDRFTAR